MVFTEFDEAVAAKGDGQMLCGTLAKDGTPHYFVMPAEADDELVSDQAFLIREGRPRSQYERWIMKQAGALTK